MNLPDLDWKYIRRFTLLPGVTAVVAAVAMFAAMSLQASQQELYQQLSADHSVMQADYDTLVERRRIVGRYHRRYQQFSRLGFVGMESRLDWIETLRATTDKLTLPRVSYAMKPQLKAVSPVESIVAGDNIQIHVSKLDLEMSLVHELDLLRFVDELQQNAPGLIKVDGCNMSWQGDERPNPSAAPNILASCSVNIYSIVTADVQAGGRP